MPGTVRMQPQGVGWKMLLYPESGEASSTYIEDFDVALSAVHIAARHLEYALVLDDEVQEELTRRNEDEG